MTINFSGKSWAHKTIPQFTDAELLDATARPHQENLNGEPAMSAPALTPAALDRAAANMLADRPLQAAEAEAWRGLVGGYQRTAPQAPTARKLLTKTVAELVAESQRSLPEHGTRPAVEIRIPGRLGGMFPGRMNRNRRDLSQPPSIVLYAAAQVLQEYGWQARPHHLRDARGRRCVCGAIAAAYDLGVGGIDAAHGAAGHVLAVLRDRGWPHPHLIGDWNQVAGRTPQQAIQLIHAARARAINAGQ